MLCCGYVCGRARPSVEPREPNRLFFFGGGDAQGAISSIMGAVDVAMCMRACIWVCQYMCMHHTGIMGMHIWVCICMHVHVCFLCPHFFSPQGDNSHVCGDVHASVHMGVQVHVQASYLWE